MKKATLGLAMIASRSASELASASRNHFHPFDSSAP